jgi:hypothetical protein
VKFNPVSLKNLDQTTHGMNGTLTHSSWKAMMRRVKAKHWYLERGITVCARWHKFENFYADMGERPTGTTLDRINNDGNYDPGNCRWATISQQQSNKRSNVVLEFNGKRQCAKHWAREIGVGVATIHWRLRHGWPVEKILSTKRFHEQKGRRKAA